MSDSPTFGMWLQRWRKYRDLTQAELAELAGCAIGTLRNIETDNARPSKQLAARLARALGVAEADIDTIVAFARNNGTTLPPDISITTGASTTQTKRSNLPAQLTGLIGRTNEIASLQALLQRQDVRLVTLTGPGGTGKTRVAIQVASELVHSLSVLFVDLSAIDDSALVLTAIAQTVGIVQRGNEPLITQLATELRNLPLLILLDNFEQVAAAAPQIATLLGMCPSLKILATSRVPLGLAIEYEWSIPPLGLPDRSQSPTLEYLNQHESVRLFIERAQAVNPHFAITTANAPAIAEICHQLDGLPLAIELASARIKLFQPQALLTRLDHRLAFLVSNTRDRPTRQQTIRNTIAWSYQLLAPEEQVLFQQLAVFVNGATIDAIEQVCRADEAAVFIDQQLAVLVNSSLLRRMPNGDSRFGMLETIREYALEQLSASPYQAAVRNRHAHFFAELVEQVNTQWDSPHAEQMIARIDQDYDNIRAALQWFRDSEMVVPGLAMATALRRYWQRRGLYAEGRALLDQLLTQPLNTNDRAVQFAKLHATHTAAWLASDQHDYHVASALFVQSIELRQALGESDDDRLLAPAARQARALGDYRRAVALLEDALARQRAAGDRGSASTGGIGQTFYDLALMQREQGQFERAASMVEEGLVLHQQIGEREGVAIGLLGQADLARDQGDAARLRYVTEQSLMITRELGIQWAIGFGLNNLAHAALLEGDFEQANGLADESLVLFQSFDATASIAEVQITKGYVLLALGDFQAASRMLTDSLRHALASGPRLMIASALEAQALVQIAQQHAEIATRLLAAASHLRQEMGTPTRPVDRQTLADAVAQAHIRLGDATFTTLWSQAEQQPFKHLLALLR